MEKWLCWASMGLAGILLLIFVMDFVSGVPFGKLNPVVDVIGILAAGIVGYLAWDAYQDLR